MTPGNRVPSEGSGGVMRILWYVLCALALAASAVMVVTDSDTWLKIAVIASLWAAFSGAVLVTRYAGSLSTLRQRSADLERRHRAELEEERRRHRERELTLENSYATRLREDRDEAVAALRRELAAMREQLAALSGTELGEEPAALRATAERIVELEREQPAPATASRPGFSTGSFAAVRWAGSDSEETAQIPLVVSTPPAEEEDRGHHRHRAPETPAAASTGGRRRADAGGRMVAELMEQLRKNS
ncbi:DUF6779 domain-containing protein [Corynebacterium bovis]|uniref:DUF6779 domain-containing protein n=1 Tax=Corynebacterium bovis TaxID=36808 RepID=UPI0021AD8507|nr:DUF6779 domain-containing protein [Corynebacterium bovis]